MAHVAKVLAVFAALGPPVGAVAFLLGVAIMGMGRNVDVAGLTWVGLFALIYGVPLSYLIGIGPALVAGLAVGAWSAWRGRATLALALTVGVVVGAGLVVLSGRPLPEAAGGEGAAIGDAVLVGTSIIATVACTGLSRVLLRGSLAGLRQGQA